MVWLSLVAARYRTVVPVELKRCVAGFASQFQGYDQHDASELLMVQKYIRDNVKNLRG